MCAHVLARFLPPTAWKNYWVGEHLFLSIRSLEKLANSVYALVECCFVF